jgi:hypothetical protein
MSHTEHPTITRTATHVGDLQIIAVEPAIAPHPHPSQNGALVPYKGVLRALLEDGTEAFLCEGDGQVPCPHIGTSTLSVVAHRNGTHNRRQPRPSSGYPEATLRRIAVEVAKAKRAGFRGHAARAAQALNDAGFTTLRGQPWDGGRVSHVFIGHCKGIRVHLPRDPGPPAPRKAVPATPAKAGPVRSARVTVLERDDLQVVRTFVTIAPALAKALTRIADYVQAVDAQARLAPEVLEKARRYDQLRAQLKD